jgi:oligosaccharide repeat unit polymerase
MKKPTLRWVGIQLGLWVYVGSAAVGLIFLLKEDRASAVIAGLVFAGVILFSKYVLGFGFLSAPILYFAGLGLFHLGLVVPWALGLYDTSEVWWFRREELGPPLGLVTLAFLGLQLGAIVGMRRRIVGGGKQNATWAKHLQDGPLFWGGLILLAVGLIAYSAGMQRVFGWGFFSLTYSELLPILGEADTRLIYFGVLFVPIGIYLAMAGASPTRLKLVLLFVGIWGMWQLFAGVRNRAFIVGLTALYLLAKKGVRLPRVSYPVMIALALLIFPAVKIMRSEVASRRLHLQALTLRDLNPLNGIAEMGGSIWPLVGTYRLADAGGLRHGRTYLYTLSKVIPGLPSLVYSGERLSSVTDELLPSGWFVTTTQPAAARLNLGPAFSPVAEAYLNFGFPGVGVIFLALGYFLVYLEQMRLKNPYVLAAQATILGPLLWSVRSDSYVLGRPIVWGLAYILVVWLVFVRSRRGAPMVAGSRASSRGSGLGPARSALPGQATCGRSGSSTVPAQSD